MGGHRRIETALPGARTIIFMSFPQPEDLQLQDRAEKILRAIAEVDAWVTQYGHGRDLRHALPRGLPAQILELRRRAENLKAATAVPVAVAIYGATGSGKSLLMGRILANRGGERTLGLAE